MDPEDQITPVETPEAETPEPVEPEGTEKKIKKDDSEKKKKKKKKVKKVKKEVKEDEAPLDPPPKEKEKEKEKPVIPEPPKEEAPVVEERKYVYEVVHEPLFDPFEKTDDEKEFDEKIRAKGGLGIEELIAVIMHADCVESVMNMSFVSKHVRNAIMHVSQNPFYSEKKLNKVMDVKQRVVAARRDLFVFKKLTYYKAQLETVETIMADKLLKYKNLKIINDGSQVNHDIFQNVKYIVKDMTVFLYPETQVNFSGLDALEVLRFDFNTNEVDTFKNFFEKCFDDIYDSEVLRELHFKCAGSGAKSLANIIVDGELKESLKIVCHFDKVTELELRDFFKLLPQAIVHVAKNELTLSVMKDMVTIVPDKDNNLWISNSLVSKEDFMKSFIERYYPMNLVVKGTTKEKIKKIDLKEYECLNSLVFNESNFAKPIKLKLPKQLTHFAMIKTDSIQYPEFKKSKILDMELIGCNVFTEIEIPKSVTKLSVEKCMGMIFINLPEESKMVEVKVVNCPKLNEINITEKVQRCEFHELRTMTNIEGLGDSNVNEVVLKYCMNLSSITLPKTLTRLQIDNCTQIVEMVNFDSINLQSFESNGSLSIEDITFPTSLSQLNLREFDSSGCATLTNLTDLTKLEKFILTESQGLEALSFPPNLTSLQLIGNHKLRCYPNLMDLKLKYIELSQSDALTKLSFPTSLETMIISGCRNCEEIPNLEEIQGLKDLNINTCSNIVSLNFPPSLTKLEIQKCKAVKELPHLHEIKVPFKNLLPFYYNLENPLIPLDLTKIKIEGWECKNIPNLSQVPLQDLQFVNCSYLTTMNVPTTVTFLELNGCKCISKIDILEKLNVQILKICYCSSLKTIKLPKTLTKLVMYDCANLQLPNTKKIPIKTLYLESMSNLKSVAIPTSLTKLEVRECDALGDLKGLSSAKQLESLHLFSFDKFKTIALPTSLTRLNLDSFDHLTGFENLEKVNLQELTIASMNQLKKFRLPYSITKFEINSCSNIKALPMIADMKIKDLTIFMMNALQSIELPKTLTKLRLDTCEILEITSLDHLVELKSLEISQCRSLQTISLPSSITDIIISDNDNLFEIKGLEKMTVEGNKLLDISMRLTNPTLTPKMIMGTTGRKRVENNGWFSTNISIADGEPLEKLAFNNCKKLTEMTFNNEVDTLQLNLCTALTKLNFNNDNYKTIVIKECTSLKNTKFPANIQTLRLDNAKSIINLDLSHCTQITRLEAIKCGKLKIVKAPPQIQIMTFDQSPALDRIECLSESGLLELSLTNCEKIKSIAPPTTLTKLRIENCLKLMTIENPDSLTNLNPESMEFVKKMTSPSDAE